jgi:hypothetical protein
VTFRGPQIFQDESKGIICYYDENGDLTCEGWDEGPHFQPDPQQPLLRRYFANFCICAWDVNCNFDASLAVISFPGVSHCVFGNSLMEFGIAHELYR